ncbi:MAG: hypothetical protein EU548_09685, partial [Promethearchaeota archaeon]
MMRESPEELAQQALSLLESAERFETEQNWAKAIESYSNAAELLKQSGYLMHRIEDIYTRITELNSYLQQEKNYQQAQSQQQLDQLQDQAFALLDAAKRLEADGSFQDAIDQYMSAIGLLAQAGWTEVQLENIKGKVMALAENLEQQKRVQQQKEMQYQQQQAPSPVGGQTQPMAPPQTSAMDQKAAALKAFEEKKRREEEMQNQAFSHIDNAKMFEKEKNYEGAIANYQKAIELLNQLGWTQQTESLRGVVEKLKRDKVAYEQAQAQPMAAPVMEHPTPEISPVLKPEAELKEFKLMEYQEKKKKEEETQNRAFNLIDQGKRLEREKNYDEAIEKFEEAIALLKTIEWDSYIEPVVNFIENIKAKKNQEVQAELVRKKREQELHEIQQSITVKQKEQFQQSAQEMELKRREFEEKRKIEEEKETQFFAILDKADKLLKDGEYDASISEYQKALELVKGLASWQSHIASLENTIQKIQELKESQAEKKLVELKKTEKRKQEEIEFQKRMAKQLQIEKEKLKEKEVKIQQRDDEVKYREQRKDQAFKFLDAAQNYIKQGNLDKAIYAYQNAGNLFAEIQWTEEIPLIEESIKALEDKKREASIQKQKELQASIQRQKQETQFQESLAKEMQTEKAKLKQRQIKLREREKELEHRERRKEEAFKLLDQAQEQVDQGNFDEALDLYHQTLNIFAEIQWQDEMELIKESIIEIENKKQDAEVWKQMELQAALEREREEKEFQNALAREMQKERVRRKEENRRRKRNTILCYI